MDKTFFMVMYRDSQGVLLLPIDKDSLRKLGIDLDTNYMVPVLSSMDDALTLCGALSELHGLDEDKFFIREFTTGIGGFDYN